MRLAVVFLATCIGISTGLGCNRKPTPEKAAAAAATVPQRSPKHVAPAPARIATHDGISDVFSFGDWRAVLSTRAGRCHVEFRRYGDHPRVVSQDLDLAGPCYVSRWASVVPISDGTDDEQAFALGRPGDAQVWKLGKNDQAILVGAIVGFDPEQERVHQRSPKDVAARCANAQQAIRRKGERDFSLAPATTSPRLSFCALRTIDLKRFAIYAEDLYARHQR